MLRPRAAAAPAVQQSIDISYPPGPQQQTRRTLLQRANGTDRRTDIVPLRRPCSAYYATNILCKQTDLDSFALDNLSVSTLRVELEPVGIEFEMFLLPGLKEWSTELQHFALDDTVRRTDCRPYNQSINQSVYFFQKNTTAQTIWRNLPIFFKR